MSRRSARETAFRTLFQVDVGKCDPTRAIRYALAGSNLREEETTFIDALVHGTLREQETIDRLIRQFLVGWELERLPAVDRNLLRLAIFEIRFRSDIPTAVSINEALELAKKYGSSDESVAFINGVLDRFTDQTNGDRP